MDCEHDSFIDPGGHLFCEFTKRVSAFPHDRAGRFHLRFELRIIGSKPVATGCFSHKKRVPFFHFQLSGEFFGECCTEGISDLDYFQSCKHGLPPVLTSVITETRAADSARELPLFCSQFSWLK